MATDLIAFAGPYQVTERSAASFIARFRDTSVGEYVTPTNAYWRLDDEDGCQIADWTALTIEEEATSATVQVAAEQNVVRNCTRQQERHTLSVMTDRGLPTQFAASYPFIVKNLAWRA
jgi:hypothetical protein